MSISRRTFLRASVTASLAGLVLVACGGEDGEAGSSGTDGSTGGGSAGSDPSAAGAGTLVAVQFFPGTFPNVGGQPQRWPFGVGNSNGVVVDAAGAPETLQAFVRTADGEDTGEPLTVARHSKDLERPYYPLVTELDAGQYQVTFVAPDGSFLEPAFFTVQEPGTTAVPVEGQTMPSFASPTTAATLDVAPICTQQPPCPFHEVSFEAALAAGKPVALLVGTPAYCATGICGPVLQLLEAAAPDYADRVTFVHAEVYTDDTLDTTTGPVQALGLDYEPSLFVVDATGTLRHRLDVIYDADELRAALDAVAAPG